MARTTKTAPAKQPGSVTTSRTSKYNPNPGRGEFIVKIGDKEAWIRPSFGAMVKLEDVTGRDFFSIAHDIVSRPMSVTMGVRVFEAMNEGDYLTPDEIHEHFLYLLHTDEVVSLSSIIRNCFNAMADPQGLRLKAVEADKVDADPKT